MNLLFDNNCVSNSPSKIDQWCKPKPAAKLVLALVRRSPLMLKERLCPSGTSPSLGEELSLDYTFCNNLIEMLML